MNYIPDAKRAVERASASEATHLETIKIVETLNDQVIWAGNVEVFALATLTPSVGYGWVVGGDKGGLEYVAVLGHSPIDSPLAAVRAWLVSHSKKRSVWSNFKLGHYRALSWLATWE